MKNDTLSPNYTRQKLTRSVVKRDLLSGAYSTLTVMLFGGCILTPGNHAFISIAFDRALLHTLAHFLFTQFFKTDGSCVIILILQVSKTKLWTSKVTWLRLLSA